MRRRPARARAVEEAQRAHLRSRRRIAVACAPGAPGRSGWATTASTPRSAVIRSASRGASSSASGAMRLSPSPSGTSREPMATPSSGATTTHSAPPSCSAAASSRHARSKRSWVRTNSSASLKIRETNTRSVRSARLRGSVGTFVSPCARRYSPTPSSNSSARPRPGTPARGSAGSRARRRSGRSGAGSSTAACRGGGRAPRRPRTAPRRRRRSRRRAARWPPRRSSRARCAGGDGASARSRFAAAAPRSCTRKRAVSPRAARSPRSAGADRGRSRDRPGA